MGHPVYFERLLGCGVVQFLLSVWKQKKIWNIGTHLTDDSQRYRARRIDTLGVQPAVYIICIIDSPVFLM